MNLLRLAGWLLLLVGLAALIRWLILSAGFAVGYYSIPR
jgi:hypothetical protein